jgi:glycosyltransferase involved in cell wall biosynthesis
MFEANRIPPAWARRAFAHDLIVVPTESSLRAWIDSGVPAHMLRVSPLGVDAARFASPVEPAPLRMPDSRLVADFRTRFLNIGELRPRKNHTGLLRAWIKATHRDDDAVLILKGSVFQQHVIVEFQADVAEMQRQEGRSLADAAPVLMLTSAVPDEMIRALYAAATHYISLSHGEGWDLPMMEAAVSGLTLIAPAHSAYLSYLRPDDAHLLPVKQVPAAIEGHLGREDRELFDGLEWWDPDVDAAAELIRDIVAGRAETKASPKNRIAAEYSWARAASRLLELINCSAPPPEKPRVLHTADTR